MAVSLKIFVFERLSADKVKECRNCKVWLFLNLDFAVAEMG